MAASIAASLLSAAITSALVNGAAGGLGGGVVPPGAGIVGAPGGGLLDVDGLDVRWLELGGLFVGAPAVGGAVVGAGVAPEAGEVVGDGVRGDGWPGAPGGGVTPEVSTGGVGSPGWAAATEPDRTRLASTASTVVTVARPGAPARRLGERAGRTEEP